MLRCSSLPPRPSRSAAEAAAALAFVSCCPPPALLLLLIGHVGVRGIGVREREGWGGGGSFRPRFVSGRTRITPPYFPFQICPSNNKRKGTEYTKCTRVTGKRRPLRHEKDTAVPAPPLQSFTRTFCLVTTCKSLAW